jgi:hypothetical protein
VKKNQKAILTCLQEVRIFNTVYPDKLYILDYLDKLGDLLATILIKNLPEDLLKELKRLKIELGCKTWAELLLKLVESEKGISLGEEELRGMKRGIQGFLKLRSTVSSKWVGHPTALQETRRTRKHEPS